MTKLEKALVWKAGPTIATYGLFFSTYAMSVHVNGAQWLSLPFVTLALLVSSLGLGRGLLRKSAPADAAIKLYVSSQVCIFLVHYLFSSFGALHGAYFWAVVIALVGSLGTELRTGGSRALSGPAVLFVAFMDSPYSTGQALVLTGLLIVAGLAVVRIDQRVSRSVWSLGAAFIILLDLAVSRPGVVLGICALAFAAVFLLFQIALIARRMTQFTFMGLDALIALGAGVVVKALVTEPTNVDYSFWILVALLGNALLLSGLAWSRNRFSREHAPLRSVSRPRVGSPVGHNPGNLWNGLVASWVATAIALGAFVFFRMEVSYVRLLLLLFVALATWGLSHALRNIVIRRLGLDPELRHVRLASRLDPRVLRYSALIVLSFALANASASLDSASITEALLGEIPSSSASAASRAEQELFATKLENRELLQTVRMGTREAALLGSLFLAGFCVLVILSDRELSHYPVFFLRGLVPLRSFIAARNGISRAVDVAVGAPLVGWVLGLARSMYTALFDSFGQGRPGSAAKVFIAFGLAILSMTLGDLADYWLPVALIAVHEEFMRGFLVGSRPVQDLEVWTTSVAQLFGGTILFAIGAQLRREYLRMGGLLMVTIWLGMSLFRTTSRLSGLFVAFTFAVGVVVFLLRRVEDQGSRKRSAVPQTRWSDSSESVHGSQPGRL